MTGSVLKSLSKLVLGFVILLAGVQGYEFGRMDVSLNRWQGSVIWLQVVAGVGVICWGLLDLWQLRGAGGRKS
jgi:hypothetical protein